MTQILLNDVVTAFAKPYEGRMTGAPGDTREAVALTDLYIRMIYTMDVLGSAPAGGPAIRVSGTPGIGTMLAVVRGAAHWAPPTGGGSLLRRIQKMSSNIISLVDAFRATPRYSSFKALRDGLSHGHALPVDDVEAAAVATALRDLCDGMQTSIQSELGDCGLDVKSGSVQLITADKKDVFELSPLWTISTVDSRPGLYSHFGAEQVYYILCGGGISSLRVDGLSAAAKSLLPAPKAQDGTLGRFVRDVVRDVAAFTEDYSHPGFYFGDETAAGFLYIPWTRPTSEGNDPRVDVFRIGPDNQHQWLASEPAGWAPYSVFLRVVANWKLLARRVRIGLEQFALHRGEEEKSRFGLFAMQENMGPSKLLEVNESLEHKLASPVFQLSRRVDDACGALKQSTSVFFIVGQAGLGKTELMLSLARKRAAELEANPESSDPLYLFVSSSGRTLATIDETVDSILNITRSLSSHGAKALCRNGLAVLFVDGFDELLGSSGYDKALGSLEPWFKDLGGRGVLVASARSSYYLTQYRRSLSEATWVNVIHTVAEVQPWSRQESEEYLQNAGLLPSAWQRLKERDWDLLGVPFFAKAFAAWHSVNRGGGVRTIFDIVVEQYLTRESSKLHDPHRGPLLSHVDLKDFFGEVAEKMFLAKTRELESSDIISCAQLAIGADDLESERPGLSHRLTALCGLDAVQGALSASKFSFSHEIMFDCFLAHMLGRHISKPSAKNPLGLLKKGKIQQVVFDWLVDQAPEKTQAASADEIGRTLQTWPSEILAENLGGLWMSLLVHRHGVPPTPKVRGLRLGPIELSESGWTTLVMEGCAIERLVIPMSGNVTIRIPESDIEVLQFSSKSRLTNVLRDVDSSRIQAILGDYYVEMPDEIRIVLEECGLVKIPPRPASVRQDDARYFFGRLATRSKMHVPVQVVVLASTHFADDYRLDWTKRRGPSAWIEFVGALIRHGLAQWEPINAGGEPKVKLVFDVSPASIAQQDGKDQRIIAFWGDLQVS